MGRMGWHGASYRNEFYEFEVFTFCKYFFACSTFLGNSVLPLSFEATKDKSPDSGTFTIFFDLFSLAFILQI